MQQRNASTSFRLHLASPVTLLSTEHLFFFARSSSDAYLRQIAALRSQNPGVGPLAAPQPRAHVPACSAFRIGKERD